MTVERYSFTPGLLFFKGSTVTEKLTSITSGNKIPVGN